MDPDVSDLQFYTFVELLNPSGPYVQVRSCFQRKLAMHLTSYGPSRGLIRPLNCVSITVIHTLFNKGWPGLPGCPWLAYLGHV